MVNLTVAIRYVCAVVVGWYRGRQQCMALTGFRPEVRRDKKRRYLDGKGSSCKIPTKGKELVGLWIFKLIAPMIFFASLTCAFAGPVLFPSTWIQTVMIVLTYYYYVALKVGWRLITAWLCVKRTAKRYQEGCMQKKDNSLDDKVKESGQLAIQVNELNRWYHMFVIPNYKEDASVLQSTLRSLGEHGDACKRYIVVLAMENREEGHEMKAKLLLEEFEQSFLRLVFTSHIQAAGEAPGKASNVDWAVRHMSTTLIDIPKTNIMCTVMDCDTLLSPMYIQELDATVKQMSNPHLRIYAPPVMFERNTYRVPVLVRIMDFMWSAGAMQNMTSWQGIGFPMSIYSLSLQLVERMNFWDTHADAIAEDIHTMCKAFYATNCKTRLVPVWVPANVLNVQSDGYWRTVKARASQAARHAKGVVDFAYALKMAIRCRGQFSSKIGLISQIFEALIMPGVIPIYLVLSGGLASLIFQLRGEFNLYSQQLLILYIYSLFGIFAMMVNVFYYELIRNAANPVFFKQPVPKWWRFPEYLLMTINIWIYVVIPFFYASVVSICPWIHDGEYVVGEKKIDPLK
eukprot:TRINITY_DN29520_c0_g1_i1.p1 TRINITY_DN29520_c0_g1~~TRINITY_DN29520_c0_g1_i1.p1  ORF type:complete len:571 (+),score=47.22 TRINITY_DN29520_c0_g1_i1:96-1808(+)